MKQDFSPFFFSFFLLFSLFFCFFLFLFFISRSFNKIETYDNSTVRILHLVLYSENTEYTQMYEITRQFYNEFPSVHTIYYTYRPHQTEDYVLEKDILYIKGEESYIPGILEKTIKAIQYHQPKFSNYDFVLRSNISTVVNFHLLIEELQKTPLEYGGGLLYDVKPEDGSEPYYFISGTAILFSIDFANYLINNSHLLEKETIDDVAIGKFYTFHYSKQKPRLIDNGGKGFLFVPDTQKNTSLLEHQIESDKIIFYRNRQEDRTTDIKNMEYIVNFLSKPDGTYSKI